jgi:hypothetical protein
VSGAVQLYLTWADIQTMRPGPRRDELAYAYRRARRARTLTDAEVDQVLLDAETHRLQAVATHGEGWKP